MKRKTLTNNCSDELHSFISLPVIFCEGRCSKVKIMTYTDIMFNWSFSEKKNGIIYRVALKPKGMQEEHDKKASVNHWPNMETTSLVTVELVLLPTSDKRWVILTCQSQVEWLLTVNHLLTRR